MKASGKTKSFLTDLLDAGKLVLARIADLSIPTKATAAAAVLAPIIAAVAGANVTAPELAGDLALGGTIATLIEHVFTVRQLKAAATAARIKRAR